MKKFIVILILFNVCLFNRQSFAGGVGILPHPPPTENHNYVYKKAITEKGDTIKVVIIDGDTPQKVEPFFKNDGEKLIFIYGMITTVAIALFVLFMMYVISAT